MPAIAAGAETAILSEWQVEEGVDFKKSDTIATVETDKAMVDMEAEDAGVILHFLVDPGTEVEVGAPIALSGSPGESVADVDAALRDLGVSAEPSASNGSAQQSSGTTQSDTDGPATNVRAETAQSASQPTQHRPGGRIFATPLVRRLARDADLDLAAVTGTGPNGRIVRRDIEGLLTQTPSSPATAEATEQTEDAIEATAAGADTVLAGYKDIPHTRIRSAIAARLTDSKRNAPHFYLRGSCRVDKLLALRKDLNTDAEKAGARKVSVNDLVVKAAARAHTLIPAMNVIWTDHAIRQFDAVDIAVAVASERGLVTPVVHDVARRSLTAVSADLNDLAERARLGKLAQREIEGGTFCISNLGMYGTEEFSAIINPPQSAILAVGAALSEPVADNGELSIATIMRVTLSVDHRPIDGSTAAEWMRAFVNIVENPLQILV
ncbi:2-oxo acid dehydrogenase subunit E2 [Mycolicibacterium chlorophenolicum]|nr:2-oxo acid dehydrogenase subunit E2 [Mycolicibacterium chlorophenolicum]